MAASAWPVESPMFNPHHLQLKGPAACGAGKVLDLRLQTAGGISGDSID